MRPAARYALYPCGAVVGDAGQDTAIMHIRCTNVHLDGAAKPASLLLSCDLGVLPEHLSGFLPTFGDTVLVAHHCVKVAFAPAVRPRTHPECRPQGLPNVAKK